MTATLVAPTRASVPVLPRAVFVPLHVVHSHTAVAARVRARMRAAVIARPAAPVLTEDADADRKRRSAVIRAVRAGLPDPHTRAVWDVVTRDLADGPAAAPDLCITARGDGLDVQAVVFLLANGLIRMVREYEHPGDVRIWDLGSAAERVARTITERAKRSGANGRARI